MYFCTVHFNIVNTTLGNIFKLILCVDKSRQLLEFLKGFDLLNVFNEISKS